MSTVQYRVEQLRNWLKNNNFDACVVPQTDPHLSEYVQDYDQVRAYFSGFTGSAGTLVVTAHRAGLWTDSRYYLQAEQQLQDTPITLFRQGQEQVPSYAQWLQMEVGNQGKVAANAYYFTAAQWQEYATLFTLVHAPQFEGLWQNRPALLPVQCQLFEAATVCAAVKIANLRQSMKENHVQACLVTALDDIAWLLNVRAYAVPYVPVLRSYLWVDMHALVWWVDMQMPDADVQAYLDQLGVQVRPYGCIEEQLVASKDIKKVWIDANMLNQRLYATLQSVYTLIDNQGWIAQQKACKNVLQLKGIVQAMEYDAVAWVRALQWLHTQLEQGGVVTELDFQAKLLEQKQRMPYYIGESFAPIVGYGKHAAIVHYEATAQSNATILPQGFLLVDAGSHYTTGTTDVTRTLVCGTVTSQQKQVYTYVLKGMIALAMAQFDAHTTSQQLDALARAPLQAYGLDYGHGTGHGVGVVLNVHERGVRISPLCVKPLCYGMVLSDEPGCYLAHHFGVRIENMLAVQHRQPTESMFSIAPPLLQKEPLYQFSVLTLIPIDVRGIDVSLLSQTEKQWVNTYHAHVLTTLQKYLSDKEYNWLKSYAYEI